MKDSFDEYSGVYFVDTEFRQPEGEIPEVHCLVYRPKGGLCRQLWTDYGEAMPSFLGDANNLIVCYSAAAEWQSFQALGWDVKCDVLDLWVVFRRLTNGLVQLNKTGQLDALAVFSVQGCCKGHKTQMREMAIRGGPFTDLEKRELMDYCQQDVEDLETLFGKLLTGIDLPLDVFRSEYVVTLAEMQTRGIPTDDVIYKQLIDNLELIKKELIARFDSQQMFENGHFRMGRFSDWLGRNRIPWPRTPKGRLATDNVTFSDRRGLHEVIADIGELNVILGKLRRFALPVGGDARCRSSLRPFVTKTGRNAPSSTKFPFGLPRWMRGVIVAPPGKALAYIDYSQQEIAVAAALSGDEALGRSYLSGDPYLQFGIDSGLIPPDATKETHGEEREVFKQVVLGVQYGMGALTLSKKAGVSLIEASELLKHHRKTYPDYWVWANNAPICARYDGVIRSVFGWELQVTGDMRDSTLKNFPCQSNGAEILRLACVMLRRAGFDMLCTVHDAILFEFPIDSLDVQVREARRIMTAASETVLSGFSVSTDVDIYMPGERFLPETGKAKEIWDLVMDILEKEVK
jgi:DNA polymerase-1